MRLEPAGAQQLDRLSEKKVVVLERAEDAEVDHAAERETRLRRGRPRRGVRLQEAERPAPRAREHDQREKPPVPPAVEHVARRHDEQVLEAETRSEQPVAREDERQKQQEFWRVEKHGSPYPISERISSTVRQSLTTGQRRFQRGTAHQ